MFINIFWVFGFFVSLVGVETKRWSTTNSIFQIINLMPRTIGILQIPMITLYTEIVINRKEEINVLFYQGIIFFNLMGVLVGFILLPFFLGMLNHIISKIYEKESLKILLRKELWRNTGKSFRNIGYKLFFKGFGFSKINKGSLFTNNLISAFLISVAFPVCAMAGYYVPAYRATIISSVSIIYGLSSIITILLIDTRVSVITDQTFNGSITLQQFKTVLFDCLKGRIIGIIIGIITLPYIAKIIVSIVTHLLN